MKSTTVKSVNYTSGYMRVGAMQRLAMPSMQ